MKAKKYLIWLVTILVSISAMILPAYLINAKVSQALGKAVLVKETGREGQVAWLKEDEAYKITSLMIQGKIDASKKVIKELTEEEFSKKFPTYLSKYQECKFDLIQEGIYPNLSEEDRKNYQISFDAMKISMYQYKENIFYNYEASVWEIEMDILDGTGSEMVEIDQNESPFKMELTLKDSNTERSLEKIHLSTEQAAYLLKIFNFSTFADAQELSVPDNSNITQRFLFELGSEKEPFWLDITSTEAVYRIEIIAAVNEK